jgi:hypothetical protein
MSAAAAAPSSSSSSSAAAKAPKAAKVSKVSKSADLGVASKPVGKSKSSPVTTVKAKAKAAKAAGEPKKRELVRNSGVSRHAQHALTEAANIASISRRTFYPASERQIAELVDTILTGALSVMAYNGGHTITTEHVKYALATAGLKAYGVGNHLSFKSARRARAAKKQQRRREAEAAAAGSDAAPLAVMADDE